MHRLETVLFSNGERFPLLVNVKTGISDFYSTLWVTVELRNQSAVNTIRNKLGTIQWIMNWENIRCRRHKPNATDICQRPVMWSNKASVHCTVNSAMRGQAISGCSK